MLYGEKSRDELNDHAVKLFTQSKSRKNRRKLYDQVKEKFSMPESVAEPMVTLKRDIKEFTTFEVFCVVYFLDNKSLGKFFTEKEIEQLSNEKFETKSFAFPIVFENVIPVTDSQWITVTSAHQLMEFKQARIINYAEGEQRALRRVKYGHEEFWKPYVNNKSVDEIKESMERGTYIPDTITLNIPEGSSYRYDEENHQLIISETPTGMLNLSDGYHRYLAMSRKSDFDSNWDYPMELRLTAFSTTKMEAFIFQQDQKTRMKQVVSDSYNPNDIANRIVSQINEDPRCYLSGKIGRNAAVINAPTLSKVVTNLFVSNKKTKKGDEVKTILEVKPKIINGLNGIVEYNTTLLDNEWSESMIIVSGYVISKGTDPAKCGLVADKIMELLTDDEAKLIRLTQTGLIRKAGIDMLDEKYMEVLKHV